MSIINEKSEYKRRVICGLSNAAHTREEDVMVIPITALKN